MFIFLFIYQSYAQKEDISEKYFGIKSGIVFSALNFGIVEETLNINTGFTGGVNYRYFNQKTVGIQIELNYSSRGGQSYIEKSKLNIANDTTGNIYFNINTKYIEFPFLMHLRFGDKYMLEFHFGSYLSYVFSQDITYEENTTNYSNKHYIENKFDYGINLGIGYGVKLNKGTLDFEIRYSNGLTNIYKRNSINSSIISQNQAVIFSLYYFWNVKNFLN